MNLDEAKAMHGMCMACDSRIQPLDDGNLTATVWQRILKDVPFADAVDVVEFLYRKPQQFVLQPGHVVEAWEAFSKEQSDKAAQLRFIDRYLRNFAESDPVEVVQAKRDQRERVLGSMSERHRAAYFHGAVTR